MNIAKMAEKGKDTLAAVPRDIAVVAVLVLASGASFGLGILAGRDLGAGRGGGFSIEQLPLTASPLGAFKESPAPSTLPAGGQVVASKNGTKYFLPWCGGAALINESNKIWFASREEAESKGYQPAANCKGL